MSCSRSAVRTPLVRRLVETFVQALCAAALGVSALAAQEAAPAERVEPTERVELAERVEPTERVWAAERAQAPQLRAFVDAGELARYLRSDSDAGPLLSAHRGGPAAGFPENALETFARSLRLAPALLECDVRQTKDGALVLMHDGTLERTTTGTGVVRERTLAELRRLRLRDPSGDVTPFRIPTLAEALAWAEGRAVLTLDIKRKVEPGAVVDAVRRLGAENRAVVIVYTVEDYVRYTALAPDLVYSVSLRSAESLERHLEAGMRAERVLAFVGVGRFDGELVRALDARGIRSILGTFGEIDRRGVVEPGAYWQLLDAGIGVLATDDVGSAAAALRTRPVPVPVGAGEGEVGGSTGGERRR